MKRFLYLLAAIVLPMLPLTWSLAMYFGSKQDFCPPNYEALKACLMVGYFGPPFACGLIGLLVLGTEVWLIRQVLKKD